MEKIECNNTNYNNYNNNNNNISKKLNQQKSSSNFLSKNPSNASLYFNIGAEFLQKNPEINNRLSLLEHDEFKTPKIEFFSRILSVDMLIDLNEIYESNWGEEFRRIYENNMNNHTPIELIAIGDTNTLMTNSIGKIYSFGWNNNSQCGLSNKASIQSFILPNVLLNNNQNEDNTDNNNDKNTPLPVVYYEKKKNLSYIYGINANYIHIFNESCFIINDKGDCYSFGNNENGQLGLGNPFPVENPTLIKILKGKAKSIKSCQDFTLSLTKDNDVFLWFCKSKNKINKNKTNNNYNNNSKTNNSINNNLYTTEESKEFTDIIESGVVYGVPFKINFLNKKIKINQISCGYNFAMLLASCGILFGLGNNKNGELGLTPEKEEIDYKNKYFYSPIQNTILSDNYQEKIISVKCGFRHTICLTSSKRVYAWGNNKYGQLGIGNYESQLIPVELYFDVFPIEKILQIQAGFRSSIFFTENRNIYYTGILDKENISNYPIKFNAKIKSPEICVENKFYIVRILSSWSKNASIFYVTVADVRRFKAQNINKINKVIDVLAKNWKDENSSCPKINTISNYFSSTYMK
jgi:alpha-tubulin suppressor-like RCC1 family protein